MSTIEAIKRRLSDIASFAIKHGHEIELLVCVDEASLGVSIDEIRACVPNGKWDVLLLASGASGRVIVPSYGADICMKITSIDSVHTLAFVKNRYDAHCPSVDFFVHNGRYVDLAEARRLLKTQAS